jgi:glycosyltransferase involved in cell wall biosynthesis
VPAARVSFIPNALDFARFVPTGPHHDVRQALGIPEGVRLGIAVGNVRQEKGTDILVEAVARSPLAQSSVILVVGSDNNRTFADACRRRAQERGVANTVRFQGERADIPDLLRAADFGIVASRTESGPLVLIELIAAGLPFVATCTGSIATRAAELQVPELVAPGDAAALGAALQRLLALDDAGLKERGLRGRSMAQAEFDMRRRIHDWTALYDAVLEAAA